MPGMSETPNAARQVSDQPSPRRLLSSRTVYEGRIWDVVSDSFQLNDDGDALVRDYIDHPGAVAILPMNDAGEVLLIKQYRHPVGMDLWEIPAGLLDVEGEDFVAGQPANSPKKRTSSRRNGTSWRTSSIPRAPPARPSGFTWPAA